MKEKKYESKETIHIYKYTNGELFFTIQTCITNRSLGGKNRDFVNN